MHAKALLERGDTSAPTCSTCHGSHGAAPPEVESVALVCAQCHVREAELFRKSPKKKLFDSLSMPECVTCHSNHHIVEPQDCVARIRAATPAAPSATTSRSPAPTSSRATARPSTT